MAAYVVGHKNPDTDSIASAIAVADLMTKRGIEAVAAAQGKPTPETEFVLGKFGVKAPQMLNDATGHKIILVDHSDRLRAWTTWPRARSWASSTTTSWGT